MRPVNVFAGYFFFIGLFISNIGFVSAFIPFPCRAYQGETVVVFFIVS